ncbi:hypothetical protein [Schlesneria sp. DSM 10557]|uniref:hypothetical protein n=1 Tax=Schlesneria sp. DSM 10557 TaxID=3044399 RepID=UPI00359F1C8A
MARLNALRIREGSLPYGLVYIGMVVLLPAAAIAEQPTLDEAMSALERWRASFSSIHITYEIDEGVIENSVPRPIITLGEYYWSEAKRFYWHERVIENGKLIRQRLDWGDGTTGGRAIYPLGEDQADVPPTMIDYGRTVAGGYNGVQGRIVTPLDGIWQPPSCGWLPEVLREQQITSRAVSRDGVELLEITYHKPMDNAPITMLLDPRHSYLPRSTLWGWEGHVSEYKQFPPGIWIATMGVFDMQERKQSWKMTSVVFNEDIADEKVRPPKPGDGTRITDMTQRKSWFHGSPPPIPDPTQENQTSPVHGDGSPIVARPFTGTWSWLPLWLTLLGISVLAISLFIRKLDRT